MLSPAAPRPKEKRHRKKDDLAAETLGRQAALTPPRPSLTHRRRRAGLHREPDPCPSSPAACPARSRQRHLSSSGSAERLWSKDQAATPLHHRGGAGGPSGRVPIGLNLLRAPTRS